MWPELPCLQSAVRAVYLTFSHRRAINFLFWACWTRQLPKHRFIFASSNVLLRLTGAVTVPGGTQCTVGGAQYPVQKRQKCDVDDVGKKETLLSPSICMMF